MPWWLFSAKSPVKRFWCKLACEGRWKDVSNSCLESTNLQQDKALWTLKQCMGECPLIKEYRLSVIPAASAELEAQTGKRKEGILERSMCSTDVEYYGSTLYVPQGTPRTRVRQGCDCTQGVPLPTPWSRKTSLFEPQILPLKTDNTSFITRLGWELRCVCKNA